MSNFLSGLVTLAYVVIALTGWVITGYSYRSQRYHPVVTLMASGMGVPVVGLLVIRLSRIFGYVSSPNDVPSLLLLVICFAYTGWAWLAALHLMRREIREDKTERRRVRTLPQAVQDARKM